MALVKGLAPVALGQGSMKKLEEDLRKTEERKQRNHGGQDQALLLRGCTLRLWVNRPCAWSVSGLFIWPTGLSALCAPNPHCLYHKFSVCFGALDALAEEFLPLVPPGKPQ